MRQNEKLIDALIQAVERASSDPSFVHHKWFVKHHLEIVDRIAMELLAHYPDADPDIVKVLAWIHDYGKTVDFDNQYEMTLTEGRKLLDDVGFDGAFVDRVIRYAEILDSKLSTDIRQAPIEVQIVSSADGCSHFVGAFYPVWWAENPDKPAEELLQDNRNKAEKDWNHKIVLPEARRAFERRYEHLMWQTSPSHKRFLVEQPLSAL
jgi:hypothetical protein